MSMKKYFVILAAAAFMLASCKEGGLTPQPVEKGTIQISCPELVDGSINAGPQGGDFTVKVTSSKDWRISGLCDWASPSKVSGKSGESVVFHVEPNSTTEALKTTFKLFAADAVAPVEIILNPVRGIELIGSAEISTGADAADVTVKVNSNVEEFIINYGGADSWVKMDRAEDIFGKKLLHFNVKRSQEFKAREAAITISGEGVEIPVAIKLTQAQRDTAFFAEGPSQIKGLEALDLNLTLKSNVDAKFAVDSWMTKEEGEYGEIGADGLKSKSVHLTAESCGGSRACTIQFYTGVSVIGQAYIKQQNPNPIYAEIKGDRLKADIQNAGWILADPVTGKCEVLETGMVGTELTIGGSSSYSLIEYGEIGGLGCFPKLAKIRIQNCYASTVDLSDCKALTNYDPYNFDFQSIDFGDLEMETVNLYNAQTYWYCHYKDVTIKGSKIKDLNAYAKSYYVYYGYSDIETMDVTGCPALTKINCVQDGTWGGKAEKFNTLYVTAAQKAAIDGGTLSVTKQDNTEITVK